LLQVVIPHLMRNPVFFSGFMPSLLCRNWKRGGSRSL